jgi:acetyl-CoA carboxylase carboxyltransferase component
MSDWDELLKDLQERRDAARAMGGSERLEKQRRDGRLDARARVDRLLDEGTFVGHDSSGRCTGVSCRRSRPTG